MPTSYANLHGSKSHCSVGIYPGVCDETAAHGLKPENIHRLHLKSIHVAFAYAGGGNSYFFSVIFCWNLNIRLAAV